MKVSQAMSCTPSCVSEGGEREGRERGERGEGEVEITKENERGRR